MSEDEFELIFTVPNIDFDAVCVEVGLDWLAEQAKAFMADYMRGGRVPTGLCASIRVLKLVHDRYMDAIGTPEWKKPIDVFAIYSQAEG